MGLGAGGLALRAITLGRDGGLWIGCVEEYLRARWVFLVMVFGLRRFTFGNSRSVDRIPTDGG